MTCASCAARVERGLNRLDGVSATVNYATERATVVHGGDVPTARLIETVEQTGYHAGLASPPAAGHGHDAGHHHHDEPAAVLARRLRLAVALTLPLAALAMLPPLQFGGWEWLALVLATPVVFVSGIGFHRATWTNARHGAASMDTLITLGTVSAWAWSAVVLIAGIDADTYFEVAAVITTLILLGRYLEARARRRSGEAIRSLVELGAREAHVLRDGAELTMPIAELARR